MDKKRTFGIRLAELFLRLHARLPLAYHYGLGRFVTWLVSDEGQACVAQAGYVPLR